MPRQIFGSFDCLVRGQESPERCVPAPSAPERRSTHFEAILDLADLAERRVLRCVGWRSAAVGLCHGAGLHRAAGKRPRSGGPGHLLALCSARASASVGVVGGSPLRARHRPPGRFLPARHPPPSPAAPDALPPDSRAPHRPRPAPHMPGGRHPAVPLPPALVQRGAAELAASPRGRIQGHPGLGIFLAASRHRLGHACHLRRPGRNFPRRLRHPPPFGAPPSTQRGGHGPAGGRVLRPVRGILPRRLLAARRLWRGGLGAGPVLRPGVLLCGLLPADAGAQRGARARRLRLRRRRRHGRRRRWGHRRPRRAPARHARRGCAPGPGLGPHARRRGRARRGAGRRARGARAARLPRVAPPPGPRLGCQDGQDPPGPQRARQERRGLKKRHRF